MNKVKQLYRRIVYGIRNLIVWFPVVWRDRDWDYVFLLALVERKLKNMSNHHKKHGLTESADTISDKLDELSELSRRIREEDYTAEAFEGYEHLLDKQKVIFEPIEGGKHRVHSIGLSQREWKQYRDCLKKEEELLSRDVEELFETMKRDIRLWWD